MRIYYFFPAFVKIKSSISITERIEWEVLLPADQDLFYLAADEIDDRDDRNRLDHHEGRDHDAAEDERSAQLHGKYLGPSAPTGHLPRSPDHREARDDAFALVTDPDADKIAQSAVACVATYQRS